MYNIYIYICHFPRHTTYFRILKSSSMSFSNVIYVPILFCAHSLIVFTFHTGSNVKYIGHINRIEFIIHIRALIDQDEWWKNASDCVTEECKKQQWTKWKMKKKIYGEYLQMKTVNILIFYFARTSRNNKFSENEQNTINQHH